MLAQKYNETFARLQVVFRDCEMYINDVQEFMNKFSDFVAAIEGYIDVGPTTHPELESKWRKFRMSVREVSATALTEHVSGFDHVLKHAKTDVYNRSLPSARASSNP